MIHEYELETVCNAVTEWRRLKTLMDLADGHTTRVVVTLGKDNSVFTIEGTDADYLGHSIKLCFERRAAVERRKFEGKVEVHA